MKVTSLTARSMAMENINGQTVLTMKVGMWTI
jgi:hypothetical protein